MAIYDDFPPSKIFILYNHLSRSFAEGFGGRGSPETVPEVEENRDTPLACQRIPQEAHKRRRYSTGGAPINLAMPDIVLKLPASFWDRLFYRQALAFNWFNFSTNAFSSSVSILSFRQIHPA